MSESELLDTVRRKLDDIEEVWDNRWLENRALARIAAENGQPEDRAAFQFASVLCSWIGRDLEELRKLLAEDSDPSAADG